MVPPPLLHAVSVLLVGFAGGGTTSVAPAAAAAASVSFAARDTKYCACRFSWAANALSSFLRAFFDSAAPSASSSGNPLSSKLHDHQPINSTMHACSSHNHHPTLVEFEQAPCRKRVRTLVRRQRSNKAEGQTTGVWWLGLDTTRTFSHNAMCVRPVLSVPTNPCS